MRMRVKSRVSTCHVFRLVMTGRARRTTVKARKGRTGVKKKQVGKGKKKVDFSHKKFSGHLLEKVETCLDSFQYEKATELCIQAMEQEPECVQVLEEVGPVLLELGQTDVALKCLKHAAELNPTNGHLKFLYLSQLHSGEEAVCYLNTAINIMTREDGCGVNGVDCSEDISRAYCSLAEIYLTDSCFTSGADEKCYNCCQNAVKYSPCNPEAHQLLASCLLSMTRNEEAKDAIRTSLSLWLPNSTEGQSLDDVMCKVELPSYFTRVNCTKILMELHLYEEAFLVLERLLRDDDEIIVVWYLMGWLHTLMNDRDSAHFYLEQANKLISRSECDDDEMVDHITELLEELKDQTVEKTDNVEEQGDDEDSDRTKNNGIVMDTT